MVRSRFLRGLLAGGGTGLVISAAAWLHDARYGAPYRPVCERIELPLPAGHDGLAGLRLSYLSDAHVGPVIRGRDLERAVAIAAAERPDLALFGGDLISEAPRFAVEAARAIGPLARSAPLGAFAVLGNHDLVFGGPDITAVLEAEGIVVLRNQAAPVETARGTLWIAGIDDTMVGSPDPAAAVAGIPAGAAILSLWHEPDRAAEMAALGAFAQLSGHSHGGQIRVPLVGTLSLPPDGRQNVIGFNDAEGMPVYTSRGVGVYRPPLRVNCPPELTIATLIPANERNVSV